MRFAERYGHREVRDALQRDSMDSPLKNALWNALLECWLRSDGDWEETFDLPSYEQAVRFWLNYLKRTADSLPDDFHGYFEEVRAYYFSAPWYDVYDFLEFVLEDIETWNHSSLHTAAALFAEALKREKSAYQLFEYQFIPVLSEVEVAEIEEALSVEQTDPVAVHLREALAKLSDKKAPDYRNSVKESISAVEALARRVSGSGSVSLGAALDQIERHGIVKLHPAVRKAFDCLYGYTSSSGGIRHSLLEGQAQVSFNDAKFMLIACSAFTNYMRAEAMEAGIHG